MRRVIFTLAMAFVAVSASAQLYYQDSQNPDIMHHTERGDLLRKEIILPQVNGYTVYKADLHIHTVFSDGNATPEYRVKEAWIDGLDVIAITDHLENRRREKTWLQYMNAEVKGDAKAEGKITLSDLHLPVREAEAAAKSSTAGGLLVIPGTEIARGAKGGHYNFLFTTDNNTVYHKDAVQSMRNARAQGALVMHNHPGWRRPSLDMSDIEKAAHAEKLIDGIEVMNGKEFYPKAITRAMEMGLFVSSNTDIHSTTYTDYTALGGHMRNMTFILAKEKTLDAMKEALKARRTIAFAYGTLAGEEQLMKDFFLASVSLEKLDGNKVNVINKTSLTFYFKNGSRVSILPPFTSRTMGLNADKEFVVKVSNIWVTGDKNLVIKKKF